MNDAESSTNQFLTFCLRDETFAVPVAKVREILEFTTPTRVPRMPSFIVGVINLRGRVVPVVELRTKLGMESGERTRHSCIVVMEVPCDGKLTEVGALVDAVQEVIELDDSQIEPPPRIGVGIDNELVTGMGKRGERFIILLHVERLFAHDFALEHDAAPATAHAA